MLHIAICEDNKNDSQTLQRLLLRHPFVGPGCRLHVYEAAGQMLLDFDEERVQFDLILLDIEMPGMDGMEAAARIRARDEHVPIVYVSVHDERDYLLRGYDAHPYAYLVKPVERDGLYRILDRLLPTLERNAARFVYRTRGAVRQIPYRDILFFEKLGESVLIHHLDRQNDSATGTERIHRKLREIQAVCGDRFLYLNRYTLANRFHITGVNHSTRTVSITGGQRIQVSRGRLTGVLQAYYLDWGEGI